MRSIWKGSIGFGLVNIPVKLYAATEESNLPFITLDKNNNARIRYKKINETTGKDVNEKDIVKGYKMGENYVILEEEDFQKATPEKIDHLYNLFMRKKLMQYILKNLITWNQKKAVQGLMYYYGMP
jgi:DNA end-binding protein Ku